MLKTQFNFLCKTFGNPKLPDNEKWKCIKYIFVENPLADVQRLIRLRKIAYVDNFNIGPGFYILGYANSDLGVPKHGERVVTFIPLTLIDKISLVTSFDENDGGSGDDENNVLYVNTDGDTLIFMDKMEVETYEDIIIINNVDAKTNNDSLIIEKK